MALLIYHDYKIVSTPVCDDNTGMWKIVTSVGWPQTRNARGDRFFTSSPQLFLRYEDAEQAGLEAGKNSIESDYGKALAR